MLFSQRIGKQPVKTAIQLDGMDDELRIGLWNIFELLVKRLLIPRFVDLNGVMRDNSPLQTLVYRIWMHLFKQPLDTLPRYFERVYGVIREWYWKCEWFEAYDFVEFVAQNLAEVDLAGYTDGCNAVMARELSAFRFVGNQLTQLTDETELSEIEQALATTDNRRLSGVREHLRAALAKFSDRKKPDYRNSIKESISAVESLCQIIGGEKATLGDALKLVAAKIALHPALQKGFSSLYGYTVTLVGFAMQWSTIHRRAMLTMRSGCWSVVRHSSTS